MSSSTQEPVTVSQSVVSHRFPTQEVCGLILIFWATLLPFSMNYLFFHPDERHYTDAGIVMHQTTDYFTPRDADGTPRFLKPILTYWIVGGSFQLFGVSPAAARIPFLIIGGACIFLGSIIAHRMFGERRTTLLASAVLAVNPLIVMASLSSLPDIVQCFFILLSVCGWIGFLKNDFSNRNAACAFVGAGFAVATKGTPGLLLCAYAVLFLAFNPWHKISRRQLLPSGWVALGVGIALFWYAIAVALHGEEAIGQFIADQVHSRLTRKWWKPFLQLPSSLILFVILIGPSCLVLISTNLGRLNSAWSTLSRERRACIGFVLGWALMLFPLLTFVDPFSIRYFLLVSPLLVSPFAWVVTHSASSSCRRFCRASTAAILLVMGTIISIFLGSSIFGTSAPGMEMILLLAGLCMAFASGIFGKFSRSAAGAAAVASRGLLVLLACTFWLISPLAIPDQSTEMADFLSRVTIDSRSHRIWYVGKPIMAGKLRVAVQGKCKIHSAEAAVLSHFPHTETVFITALDVALDQLDSSEYLILPISDGWRDLSATALIGSWLRGGVGDYLAERREQMAISIPLAALEAKTVCWNDPSSPKPDNLIAEQE